ncbi:hypothetical protein [Sphingobium sp.]|uniref:hypothetical protein n=1 Tax=Sphingobium sp. TaxID=1912891 RepID=UPI0028BD29CF|nr:hypothetical protein [Sphingobium sp.]
MTGLGEKKSLGDIPVGQLYTDPLAIAQALDAQRIDETDCGFTGLLEITDDSGWHTQQMWATDADHPSSPTAVYVLIYANGKLASVDDWPMG